MSPRVEATTNVFSCRIDTQGWVIAHRTCRLQVSGREQRVRVPCCPPFVCVQRSRIADVTAGGSNRKASQVAENPLMHPSDPASQFVHRVDPGELCQPYDTGARATKEMSPMSQINKICCQPANDGALVMICTPNRNMAEPAPKMTQLTIAAATVLSRLRNGPDAGRKIPIVPIAGMNTTASLMIKNAISTRSEATKSNGVATTADTSARKAAPIPLGALLASEVVVRVWI